MHITLLAPTQAAVATAVLCEAFADYPVMHFVLGRRSNFSRRLHTLIGFFVTARFLRNDLVFGLFTPSRELHGVALVTLPGEAEPPAELARRRDAVWQELGTDARARYEAFGAASRQFDIADPHHHLNMVGVPPAHAGRGHGRRLLDHVHATAAAHAHSAGVSLTTEVPENVPLYQHFGYQQRGHAVVGAGLETWALYRPNPGEAPR